MFDIVLSQTGSDIIEAVCWDRDRFRKDYLGEFSQNIFDLFKEGVYSLDDPENDVRAVKGVTY